MRLRIIRSISAQVFFLELSLAQSTSVKAFRKFVCVIFFQEKLPNRNIFGQNYLFIIYVFQEEDLNAEVPLVAAEIPRKEISPIKSEPSEVKKEPKEEGESSEVKTEEGQEEVKTGSEATEGSEVKTEPTQGELLNVF